MPSNCRTSAIYKLFIDSCRLYNFYIPTMEQKANKSTTRPKFTHPPVATMVNKAIEALDTKGGSSVRAIKKYMESNFCVEADKLMPFIKKYLARAVENNVLIQATGKGLAGSYKLAVERKKAKAAKAVHVTASDLSTKVQEKKNVKKSSPKAKQSTAPAKSKNSTTSKSKSATPIKQKPVGKRASLLSTATKAKSPSLTKSGSSTVVKPKTVGRRASRDSILLMRKKQRT